MQFISHKNLESTSKIKYCLDEYKGQQPKYTPYNVGEKFWKYNLAQTINHDINVEGIRNGSFLKLIITLYLMKQILPGKIYTLIKGINNNNNNDV